MKLRWAVAIIATVMFGAVPAYAAPVVQPGALGPTTMKLAFTSHADGQADIYTMNAAGQDIFNVTHDQTIGSRTDVEPVWSPSGTAVAFERQSAVGGADLMVVNADGSNLHSVVTSPAHAPVRVWNCHPSWADDNTVYFTSNRDGNFDLYAVSIKGTGLKQLTRTAAPIENRGPAVSPDGRTLVFYRTGAAPGGNGIFLLNLTAGVLTHVVSDRNGATYSDPAWSPSGTQIAYTSDVMGSDDIWTVNVGPTAMPIPVRVTDSVYSDVHPTYSPDGRTLAFVSDRTRFTEIYTTPVESIAGVRRPVTQLTFDQAFKANPSWHLVTIGSGF